MFIPSTIPGQMAIFSFFRVVAPLRQGPRRLIVSTCSMPWSQEREVWLDPSLTQETLFLRLEGAFRSFGGVPRQLATRTVRPLGRPAVDGECPWSRPFLRFCAHLGCKPVPIPGGAPHDADIRADVEDVLHGGHDWRSIEEIEQALQHRAMPTGSEATHLLPMPERSFLRDVEIFRRVASDGFVIVAGDNYSVPLSHAGHSVWIRHSQGRIVIRSQDGRHLATHNAGDGRGTVRVDPKHFEPTRLRAQRDLEKLTSAFRSRFPHHTPFLEQLIAQRKLAAATSLRTVLALASIHDPDAVEKAIAACHRCNNFSHRFLQGLLDRSEIPATPEEDESAWIQGELF